MGWMQCFFYCNYFSLLKYWCLLNLLTWLRHCVYIYWNWLREQFLYLAHVVHNFLAINRLKIDGTVNYYCMTIRCTLGTSIWRTTLNYVTIYGWQPLWYLLVSVPILKNSAQMINVMEMPNSAIDNSNTFERKPEIV